MVDFRTVQLLQCRCPGLDQTDTSFITEQMSQRNLFPSIDDVPTRMQIRENLLKVPHLIPSLATFFEDTKWLEPVAKVIRRLLPPSCKESNRRALFRKYTGLNHKRGTVQIQRFNQKWASLTGDEALHMECGYRQLCTFAWRHFPELVAIAPRKDKGKARPQIKAVNKQSWRRVAQLAQSLGFDSEEIANLAKHNPDLAMVISFLGQVRPQEFYNQSNNGSSVNEICRILEGIEEQSVNVAVVDSKHVDVPLEYRCGRPFEISYESSRDRFFLFDLNSSFGNGLSHFSVQRDIFRAFFGSNFLPLFEDSQLPIESVSNPVRRENGPRNRSLSTTNQANSAQGRFDIPSGQFTFSRVTKPPGKRAPLRRMRAISETIAREQETVETDVGMSDETGEGQALQEQEDQLQNANNTQSQEEVSPEQTIEQVNISHTRSEGQAFQEQEVEMQNTDATQREERIFQEQADDRTTSNPQTEEPVSQEPGIRQGEIQNPAQPLTQSGNDEVQELFEDVEAPGEKFSLPLGSQANGPPLARHEPHRNTSPAKEQNQKVTSPEPDIFKLWDKKCEEGDWVLVDAERGKCWYIAAEEEFAIKSWIGDTADNFYYAFYDEAKGKLSTLRANKLLDWGKSKDRNHDGVIYVFRQHQEPRHSGIISFNTFRGASTKIRLELIQASKDAGPELIQAGTEKRKNKRPASVLQDPFACLENLGKKQRRTGLFHKTIVEDDDDPEL